MNSFVYSATLAGLIGFCFGVLVMDLFGVFKRAVTTRRASGGPRYNLRPGRAHRLTPRVNTCDPLHPATLLPIMADGLDAPRAQAGAAVNAFLKWFTAPYHERLQHDTASPTLEP